MQEHSEWLHHSTQKEVVPFKDIGHTVWYMLLRYDYFKAFDEFVGEVISDDWLGETVTSLIFGHRGPQLGEVH